MRHVFFDTETTGKPVCYQAHCTDIENWPRLVQVAWLVADDAMPDVPDVRCHVVRPDGFQIPREASAIHGIAHQDAIATGRAIGDVLDEFMAAAMEADLLVGHNVDFDRPVVAAELVRQQRDWEPFWGKASFCTMKVGTDVCRIPGRYGYKWPKLSELYKHLFGMEPDVAHKADADMIATAKCYFEMMDRGLTRTATSKIAMEALGS